MRRLFDKIQYWWWGNSIWVGDLLSVLGPWIFMGIIILCMNSCGTIKEIPVQTIEKIEYRDSLIYVSDTITVEIPQEKVIYVGPADTTSQIATSLAFSEAKIDKGVLTHTLEQKGELKVQYDTIIKVEYVDRVIEKEVPIIQEIEIPKYDTLFWILFGWTMFTILIIILRLCFKSETLLR